MPWWPCGDNAAPPAPQPPPYTGSLQNPNVWTILYSPGMPLRPTAAAEGAGWYFDFPAAPGSVHYVVARISRPISGTISADISIDASPDAVWNAKLKVDNTGDMPPQVRLFFQRSGDKMTSAYEHYRWWSDPAHLVLRNGRWLLAVMLTPDAWTSVNGRRGTDAPDAFAAALRECFTVGVTFGGGSFYGHGVNLSTGASRFNVKDFSVQ